MDDSLPMSLEVYEPEWIDIVEKDNKEEVWLIKIKSYQGSFLTKEKIESLLSLDLNFSKFNREIRTDVLKLFSKILRYYGLKIKKYPLQIVDISDEKEWIMKGSQDYYFIELILAFLILSGMWKMSYIFLQKLLTLYKLNKDKISLEDFQKWNKIVGCKYI